MCRNYKGPFRSHPATALPITRQSKSMGYTLATWCSLGENRVPRQTIGGMQNTVTYTKALYTVGGDFFIANAPMDRHTQEQLILLATNDRTFGPGAWQRRKSLPIAR